MLSLKKLISILIALPVCQKLICSSKVKTNVEMWLRAEIVGIIKFFEFFLPCSISDIEIVKKKTSQLIIPTISALSHISTLVLNKEEEINFWQTGRAIKVDTKYFKESKTFDYEKPIKVLDKGKDLLGIGFFNKEQTNINPKLVLNAK